MDEDKNRGGSQNSRNGQAKNGMTTWLGVVIALVIVGGALWYFFPDQVAKFLPTGEEMQASNEGIVARVNGEEITRKEFEESQSQIAIQQGIDVASLDVATKAQFDTQVLDSLISRELLRQAIAAAGTQVSDEEVNSQVEQVKSQFESQAAYEAALVGQGVTEAEFSEQVRNELSQQAYLQANIDTSGITVSDEEIQAVYDQAVATAEDAPSLEEVRGQIEASLIQQKQQQLVNAFIAELRAQADVEIFLQ